MGASHEGAEADQQVPIEDEIGTNSTDAKDVVQLAEDSHAGDGTLGEFTPADRDEVGGVQDAVPAEEAIGDGESNSENASAATNCVCTVDAVAGESDESEECETKLFVPGSPGATREAYEDVKTDEEAESVEVKSVSSEGKKTRYALFYDRVKAFGNLRRRSAE